jgi:hypothetical protein
MKKTPKTKTRKTKASSARKATRKKVGTRKKTATRKTTARKKTTTSKARIKRTIESIKSSVKVLEKEVGK